MGRYSSLGWMIALGALALVLSPVVVLIGEPTLRRRRHSRRTRRTVRTGSLARSRSQPHVPRTLSYAANGQSRGFELLLLRFSMHPLVIALTAPSRWVRHRLHELLRRRRAVRLMRARYKAWKRGGGGHEGLFPDDPPFLSGVREPRRPKPGPPSDAIALQSPTEHSALD